MALELFEYHLKPNFGSRPKSHRYSEKERPAHRFDDLYTPADLPCWPLPVAKRIQPRHLARCVPSVWFRLAGYLRATQSQAFEHRRRWRRHNHRPISLSGKSKEVAIYWKNGVLFHSRIGDGIVPVYWKNGIQTNLPANEAWPMRHLRIPNRHIVCDISDHKYHLSFRCLDTTSH
jgi:hypothetical protein